MCGRYTITDPEAIRRALEDVFGIVNYSRTSRYNVAPRQMNPVVVNEAGGPALVDMSWGLVPFWDKSEKPKIAPINARSEDVLTKPSFRQAVQKRRLGAVANGFFEWQTLGASKQPFYMTLKEGQSFFIAGIYEDATPTRPAGYALLTTTPNEVVGRFHDRMPIILTGDRARQWLAPGPMTPELLESFRVPFPESEMQAWPVSTIVNKPANDVPECIVPMS